MTLGEKLQKLRKSQAWTQEELAEKVGVSRQSLSKWESDGALPDTANIIVLADLFGVTTDYLLREAPPADAAAPADSPAAPPVIQLVPPQKKAPPTLLLLGGLLLALGLIGYLALQIAQAANPCNYFINGREYTGLQGYIRTYHMQIPYYASLAAMASGAFMLLYHGLQRLLSKTPDTHDDESTAP